MSSQPWSLNARICFRFTVQVDPTVPRHRGADRWAAAMHRLRVRSRTSVQLPLHKLPLAGACYRVSVMRLCKPQLAVLRSEFVYITLFNTNMPGLMCTRQTSDDCSTSREHCTVHCRAVRVSFLHDSVSSGPRVTRGSRPG